MVDENNDCARANCQVDISDSIYSHDVVMDGSENVSEEFNRVDVHEGVEQIEVSQDSTTDDYDCSFTKSVENDEHDSNDAVHVTIGSGCATWFGANVLDDSEEEEEEEEEEEGFTYPYRGFQKIDVEVAACDSDEMASGVEEDPEAAEELYILPDIQTAVHGRTGKESDTVGSSCENGSGKERGTFAYPCQGSQKVDVEVITSDRNETASDTDEGHEAGDQYYILPDTQTTVPSERGEKSRNEHGENERQRKAIERTEVLQDSSTDGDNCRLVDYENDERGSNNDILVAVDFGCATWLGANVLDDSQEEEEGGGFTYPYEGFQKIVVEVTACEGNETTSSTEQEAQKVIEPPNVGLARSTRTTVLSQTDGKSQNKFNRPNNRRLQKYCGRQYASAGTTDDVESRLKKVNLLLRYCNNPEQQRLLSLERNKYVLKLAQPAPSQYSDSYSHHRCTRRNVFRRGRGYRGRRNFSTRRNFDEGVQAEHNNKPYDEGVQVEHNNRPNISKTENTSCLRNGLSSSSSNPGATFGNAHQKPRIKIESLGNSSCTCTTKNVSEVERRLKDELSRLQALIVGATDLRKRWLESKVSKLQYHIRRPHICDSRIPGRALKCRRCTNYDLRSICETKKLQRQYNRLQLLFSIHRDKGESEKWLLAKIKETEMRLEELKLCCQRIKREKATTLDVKSESSTGKIMPNSSKSPHPHDFLCLCETCAKEHKKVLEELQKF